MKEPIKEAAIPIQLLQDQVQLLTADLFLLLQAVVDLFLPHQAAVEVHPLIQPLQEAVLPEVQVHMVEAAVAVAVVVVQEAAVVEVVVKPINKRNRYLSITQLGNY